MRHGHFELTSVQFHIVVAVNVVAEQVMVHLVRVGVGSGCGCGGGVGHCR